MPLKSRAQERWMWATHPEMAKRWEKHTPKDTKLPERVKENESMSDDAQDEGYGMDEGPLDFLRSKLGGGGDKKPPASGRTLDVASLRDPQGFIDGVHKFSNSLEQNVKTLQHFADIHAQKVQGPQQKTLAALSAELKSLKSTIEPALAKMGRAALGTATTSPGRPGADAGKSNPADPRAASDELPRGQLPKSPISSKAPTSPGGPSAGVKPSSSPRAPTPTAPTVDLGKGKDAPMASLFKKQAVPDDAPRAGQPVSQLAPRRRAQAMPAVKDEPEKPSKVQGFGGMAQRAGLRRPFG